MQEESETESSSATNTPSPNETSTSETITKLGTITTVRVKDGDDITTINEITDNDGRKTHTTTFLDPFGKPVILFDDGKQNLMDILLPDMQGVPLGDFILRVLTENRENVVVQAHGGTYFDGAHIVINQKMLDLDRVAVHETLHLRYDKLGITANPLTLWLKDFVRLALDEEADAEVLAILYNIQWRRKVPGRTRVLPSEKLYQAAYSQAMRALEDTDLTADELHDAAHVAGWYAVRQYYEEEALASGTKRRYPDLYTEQWYRINQYSMPTPLPDGSGCQTTSHQRQEELQDPQVSPPTTPLVVSEWQPGSVSLLMDTWQTYQGYRVPRLPQRTVTCGGTTSTATTTVAAKASKAEDGSRNPTISTRCRAELATTTSKTSPEPE